MNKLYLYSTIACHLCEEAEEMLVELQQTVEFTLVKRDIIDNAQWLEKYRVSIPVLELNQKELLWPFNKSQIVKFLED